MYTLQNIVFKGTDGKQKFYDRNKLFRPFSLPKAIQIGLLHYILHLFFWLSMSNTCGIEFVKPNVLQISIT